jgi:hypothetical protein
MSEKRTPNTPTNSMELVTLRVSLAQACQVCRVETPDLPVLGKSFEQLCLMAKTKERGWNTLANALKERLQQLLN